MSENVPAPAQPSSVPDVTDHEALYEYTQQQRLNVADILLKDKASIPHMDPKLLNIALKSLGDMDRQALSRDRMKVDESVAQNDAETAKILSEALSKLPGHNPHMLKDVNPVPTAAPMPELPEPEVVPGELDVGIAEMSVRDFDGSEKTDEE